MRLKIKHDWKICSTSLEMAMTEIAVINYSAA